MAINMMDIVRKNGDKINIKALGEKLGCEVVEISALKKTGIKETAEKAIEIANLFSEYITLQMMWRVQSQASRRSLVLQWQRTRRDSLQSSF
jgi:Fe2+ transport system protein B